MSTQEKELDNKMLIPDAILNRVGAAVGIGTGARNLFKSPSMKIPRGHSLFNDKTGEILNP